MSEEQIARLRLQARDARFRQPFTLDNETVARGYEEAAAALERAERVVAAARAVRDADDMDEGPALLAMYAALRELGTPRARPCPNSVSWCGGPDRYGDTCAACLATWTEEAKEKAGE